MVYDLSRDARWISARDATLFSMSTCVRARARARARSRARVGVRVRAIGLAGREGHYVVEHELEIGVS